MFFSSESTALSKNRPKNNSKINELIRKFYSIF